MRTASTMFAALVWSLCMASLSTQAEEQVLLQMPEPPAGMTVTKTPLKVEEEIVGYHVQVADQEGVSKVIVQIETKGDRSAKSARVDGLKSYVNGLANGLKKAGYELEANEVPNLKTADLSEQLRVEMRFSKDDKTELYVRQFIYFTDKGYNVQVLAADQQELERLTRWANHVRPAEAPPEVAWRAKSAE